MSPAHAFARARALLDGPLLLASDFDGTLAVPARDPWQTAILPAAQRALRRLAMAPGVHVALISGRTVADLSARAAIAGASYHGDHGAERALAPAGWLDGPLAIEREGAPPDVIAAADRLKAEVPRLVDEPWLVVEDKGAAVTFHFRAAPDIAAAQARVAAAIEVVDPARRLVRVGGRRAQELRPPGATTKALVLERLMRSHEPASVMMLGDDHHDAAAFEVLRGAREAGRISGMAIAVGGSAASIEEMAAHADLALDAPEAVAEFLGLLADLADGIGGSSPPHP